MLGNCFVTDLDEFLGVTRTNDDAIGQAVVALMIVLDHLNVVAQHCTQGIAKHRDAFEPLIVSGSQIALMDPSAFFASDDEVKQQPQVAVGERHGSCAHDDTRSARNAVTRNRQNDFVSCVGTDGNRSFTAQFVGRPAAAL